MSGKVDEVDTVDTVNSLEDLVNNFLEFKNITFDDNIITFDDKKEYTGIHNFLTELTDNEIRFALTIINKIEGNKLRNLGQNGGDDTEQIITFKPSSNGTTVTITKRNKFLYYVLNIFFMLITFSIIKSFFQNTINLNMVLIEENVKQVQNEIAIPNGNVDQMNSYINSLRELLATEVILQNIEPLILPKSLKLPETSLDSDNDMFTTLKKIYGTIKENINFEPEKHLPDVNKLLQIHEIAIRDLNILKSTDKPIITTLFNMVKSVDKTQQKIMLYQQIVNLFPIVLASTNLKILTVTNLTLNIYYLLAGLFFRMSIMLAISKFIHTHCNMVIELIADTRKVISLNDYNELLESEIKEQNKKAITILNSIFSSSNLSITDEQMITEEIMTDITLKKIENLNEFIKNAVEEAVDELPENQDRQLIKNGANKEKKIGGKTRRKIRRNKKAKTKKMKVNKKTTKKKMKAKKKTKMNRKKSKRRRNKK